MSNVFIYNGTRKLNLEPGNSWFGTKGDTLTSINETFVYPDSGVYIYLGLLNGKLEFIRLSN